MWSVGLAACSESYISGNEGTCYNRPSMVQCLGSFLKDVTHSQCFVWCSDGVLWIGSDELQYYYWHIIVVLHMALMILCKWLLFNSFYQGPVALLVTGGILMAQCFARPFESTKLDRLQSACVITEFLIILLGILFTTHEGAETYQSQLIVIFYAILLSAVCGAKSWLCADIFCCVMKADLLRLHVLFRHENISWLGHHAKHRDRTQAGQLETKSVCSWSCYAFHAECLSNESGVDEARYRQHGWWLLYAINMVTMLSALNLHHQIKLPSTWSRRIALCADYRVPQTIAVCADYPVPHRIRDELLMITKSEPRLMVRAKSLSSYRTELLCCWVGLDFDGESVCSTTYWRREL